MTEKIINTGTVLSLLVLNDKVRARNSGLAEIMYDPIFYIILISGIVISLTIDNKDPATATVERPMSYFLYSFFASVILSALVVGAKIELQIGWLMFYGLIAVTTTLSPAIVRRLITSLPLILSEGIEAFFASFFKRYNQKKGDHDNN